eukprot:TRINITY_DN9257_c0_g1_i1.p1 TRINITY_DN9257_c0_g1~~TRINITY_DN9257_c0_g1_i1.p1  ORF type:complete len:617 (+),score=124.06 TRINITY_DN9257_c0_g1_i1:113-1852(+)
MGNRTTPSILAFTDEERLVGEAAKAQQGRNPKNTIYDAKRMIGRRFIDPTIQHDLKLWPFKVVEGKNGLAVVEVEYKGERVVVTPEEISSAILMKMKEIAQNYTGSSVSKAVITVPAYFNDAQRQATKDAGTIAGLDVVRIINEPTAAALAYGLDRVKQGTTKNLLMFDFGGGTLDVTILTVDSGIFEVLSTSGDTHLGGEDFDNLLVLYLVSEFQKKHKQDVSSNARALKKLKDAAQKAKHVLSVSLKATIEIDSLHDGIDFDLTITRVQFEQICGDLFARMLIPVKKAMEDAKLSTNAIDDIVLVGGSTRIPEVQKRLEQFFDKPLCKSINPDEAVAMGACLQATNLNLSFEKKQGTKLANLTLMDVTPLSLGIDVKGGKMSILIPRNTPVPYSHTKTYYNNKDNATEILIEVFEGENILTQNNRLLGQFVLKGLPPRPRGDVRIDVTFSIDTNSILEVSAACVDKDSKVSGSLKIDQNKGLLSQDEIGIMTKEARNIEIEERNRLAKAKALNELEKICAKYRSEIDKIKDMPRREKFDHETMDLVDMIKDTNLSESSILEKKKWLQNLWDSYIQDV